MQILDSHQHFWKRSLPFDYRWLEAPELAPICRDFLPEDLEPHLKSCGISESIFVQTQHNVEENRWVLGLAETHPFLAGVVGWVDLASTQVEQQIEEFAARPKFLGVRHVTQDEPDDNFIVRPEILRGLRLLEKHQVPFDLLFYVKHLRHVPRLAAELPNLKMVIDHLAKPQIKSAGLDAWKADFQKAAAYPNVYCKLSGMVTEAKWNAWTTNDLKPYVDIALESFGPGRLMYGSDWPVCELAGSYAQVFEATRSLTSQLSESEQQKIFRDTARSFYNLSK